ncbi:MAG: flagellin [Pseudomonadales bacterium]
MTAINTNVSATLAANALTRNERTMSTAMERLSTGQRINSAKDDAAGLAISSRMTSQIRGLDQAVRNANDATSLLQTAEGALDEVTNMMQRMRELAVQASSDTYSSDDRDYLDDEFQALATEITRVRDTTEFNDMLLLDGSTASFTFQIGSEATQTMAVAISDIAGSAGTNGTAIAATITAPDGTNGQVSVLDFATDYSGMAADETVSLTIGDQSFNYTVTAADVADLANSGNNNDDGVGDLLATNLAAMINSNTSMQGTIHAAASSDGTNTLTLTGVDVDNPYSVEVMAGATDATSVSGDITTQSNASTAITTLDTAIASISSQRASLGAFQNRLTHTVDNLSNISMNTESARGQITDADYAKETTELARTQIIAQAGTAMLAQANQVKQSVLALLQ